MARLYADENFPLQVVEYLRRLGHDVLTVQEDGCAGQAMTDPAVLARATGQERALLTLDRWDFIRLHPHDSQHGGIIVCTFDADFERQARRIDAVIGTRASLDGELIRINRPV
jgi:predicted nuclease of predicted toxin-antitoxin system